MAATPRINFSEAEDFRSTRRKGEYSEESSPQPFAAKFRSSCTHPACPTGIIKPDQTILCIDPTAKEYQHAACHHGSSDGDDEGLSDIVNASGYTGDGTYRTTEAYSKPTKFQGQTLEEMGF